MAHPFLKSILAFTAQEAFVASAAGAQCLLPNAVERIVSDDLSLLQTTLNIKQRVNQKTGQAVNLASSDGRYCCCTEPGFFTEDQCIDTGMKYHREAMKDNPEYAAGKYSSRTGKTKQGGGEVLAPMVGLAWAGWDPENNQCCRYKYAPAGDCDAFFRKGAFTAKFKVNKGGSEKTMYADHCEAVMLKGLSQADAALQLKDIEARSAKAAEEAEAKATAQAKVAKEAADAKAAKEKARRDRRHSRAKYQTQTDICSIAAKEGNCHTVVRAESKPCNHYWYTNKWGNNKMCDERSGLTCGHSKNPFRSSADCPPGTR